MKRFFLFALLLLPAPALAEDNTRTAALAMIPADQRVTKTVVFGETITIVTDRRLPRTPKPPAAEAAYKKFYDDAGVDMAYPLDVKLRANDANYYVLRCDSGGSNDPQCVFSTSQDPDQPGVAIPGTVFVIPGDGCVYSGGHTDNMFDTRALHCLQGAELKPVAQPFNYAGLRSKALKELTLYADKNNSAIVTKIAPGAFVEVVLQDGDFFLLRDRFGLAGWVKLDTGAQKATEIDGFYYNGD